MNLDVVQIRDIGPFSSNLQSIKLSPGFNAFVGPNGCGKSLALKLFIYIIRLHASGSSTANAQKYTKTSPLLLADLVLQGHGTIRLGIAPDKSGTLVAHPTFSNEQSRKSLSGASALFQNSSPVLAYISANRGGMTRQKHQTTKVSEWRFMDTPDRFTQIQNLLYLLQDRKSVV